jgi:putative hydrolase of the HAD superfamily
MKALIFDFDGLIIDTEWTWYQVYREVYREHGLDLPMELYARFLGTSGAALRHLIEQTGADSETVKKLLIDRHAAWAKHETLRPGVADYLKQAREMGLKIGLSSSSSRSWVKRYLEPHGLTGFIDVILTREDVTKVKPDPELYLKTIRHLGISPGEAVAFRRFPQRSQGRQRCRSGLRDRAACPVGTDGISQNRSANSVNGEYSVEGIVVQAVG